MANPEHLAILKQGVEAWNKWSEELPFGSWPDLSGAQLNGANLHGANLSRANLTGTQLREADLCESGLDDADLRRADLSGADLRSADLLGANLSRAILWRTRLSRANLSQANLSAADLTEADLRMADLSAANLREANLTLADLSAAHVDGADFALARSHATHFADLDLSAAEGLEYTQHEFPSTIGINTIYKSRGKIPEAFLRGCGAPGDFIQYVKSIAGAIQFYSCFISHSTKDKEFTDKLCADLQNNGVHYWCARENLKIGDRFQERIEELIWSYDKLLLVLSQDSIQSPWVEREVQAAFEQEHKRKKAVLLPIRLDKTVMETRNAWAADIRRTRHIGEFDQWREHNSYIRAFDRLLRDLRVQTAVLQE